MKTKCLITVLVAVLLSSAFAQEKQVQEQSGSAEFGVRQVWGDVYGRPDIPFKLSLGSSKYNEYRSVTNGMFLRNFSLNIDNLANTRTYFNLRGRDSLEKDQAYLAKFGRYGVYTASFQYDQTPHIFSNAGRILFSQPSPGVFRLSSLVRTTLQGTSSAQIPTVVNGLMAQANRIDLSLRRNTSTGKFLFTPTADLGVSFEYSNEKQTGARAIGAHMFASPSNTTLELPEPIDYRTQNFKTGVDFGKQTWALQFGYLGSFFENKVGALIWDNPFRTTDLVDTSSTGQMDLYPDNQAHSLNFAGAVDLGKYVRLMTSITPGWMRQNDAFLPGTVNTAIAGMQPLPSAGLNGKKQTLAMNYTATSRPVKNLELTARYRQYDYQNDTAIREFSTIQADSASLPDHGPIVHENKPYSFFKKNVELASTWFFTKKNSVKLGYEFENMEREHRDVENSTENSFVAGVDLNPWKVMSFRANYRHANRNPELYLDETIPDQLPNTRRFDESARVRDRFDVLLEVSPTDKLTFSGSYGTTQDNYDQPDASNPVVYGLLKDISYNYGFDVNYVVAPEVTFFGEYTREKYNTRMLSRQRNFPLTAANADVANNDWASAQKDAIDTYSTGFDFLLNKRKLSISTFYSLSAAKGNVLSTRLGNPALPGFLVTAIADYPETTSRLHQICAVMRFKLPKNISPKLEYRFDQFDVVDFQTNFMNPYMFSRDSGTRQMFFLGGDAPSYRGHALSAGVEYHF